MKYSSNKYMLSINKRKYKLNFPKYIERTHEAYRVFKCTIQVLKCIVAFLSRALTTFMLSKFIISQLFCNHYICPLYYIHSPYHTYHTLSLIKSLVEVNKNSSVSNVTFV